MFSDVALDALLEKWHLKGRRIRHISSLNRKKRCVMRKLCTCNKPQGACSRTSPIVLYLGSKNTIQTKPECSFPERRQEIGRHEHNFKLIPSYPLQDSDSLHCWLFLTLFFVDATILYTTVLNKMTLILLFFQIAHFAFKRSFKILRQLAKITYPPTQKWWF